MTFLSRSSWATSAFMVRWITVFSRPLKPFGWNSRANLTRVPSCSVLR